MKDNCVLAQDSGSLQIPATGFDGTVVGRDHANIGGLHLCEVFDRLAATHKVRRTLATAKRMV